MTMLSKKTLAKIEHMLHDTCGREESDARNAGRILIVSARVGGNAAKVADALGWDVAKVQPYAKRLLKNGVWTKDGKVMAGWLDPKDGDIAFALDVNIALGFIVRARSRTGKIGARTA